MSEPIGAPSGLMRGGTVPSAFNARKLLGPLGISSAFTVMLAFGIAGFPATAKTDRAMPECGATVTSNVVVGAGSGLGSGVVFGAWTKEAKPPPAGWFAMVRRKLLVKFVKFCRTMTKARWTVALSGFEFCGDVSRSP